MSDSNVIHLRPCADPAQGLRNIADSIDSGEIEADEITVISGTDIFHVGMIDDGRAAEGAIFNMTVGIHRLMKPIMDSLD